jgi:drug/metabolite transporter (DMT)-like permease
MRHVSFSRDTASLSFSPPTSRAMLKSNGSAWLLLSFAPLAWASNIVVGRYLAGLIEPDLLNLLRWIGTAAVLFPFVAAQLFANIAEIRKSLAPLVVAGIIGLGLFQTLLYSAVTLSTATHVATALALSPLVALMVSGRAKPTVHQAWIGFIVSLTGVLLVQSNGLARDGLDHAMIKGDLIALAAALLWGCYNVLAAQLPKTVPPFVSLFVMSSVAAIFSAIPVVAYASMGALLSLPMAAWLAVVYLVIVVSIAGLGAYNTGIRRLGASAGGLFIHLTPVFTIAMSYLFLSEAVTTLDLLGFGMVICGMVIALRPYKRPAS